MQTGLDLRDRAVAGMLRQLGRGLSTYRLFPDDPDQPAFVAAADRITAAAGEALGSGPLAVEVFADGVRTASGAEVPDDSVLRLARACYERRVELLQVRDVPDPSELTVLYRALTMPAEEVAAEGGVPGILRAARVSSILAEELAVRAGEQSDPGAGGPGPQAESLPAEDLAKDLSGSPTEQARTLLGRLEALARLAPGLPPGSLDLYRRLSEAVAALSEETRRILAERLASGPDRDPEAARVAGLMTDSELARILVELSEGGSLDPVELARRLVAEGARRQDLVDLAAAAAAGREAEGTLMASAAAPPDRDEDARALREAFPTSPEDQRVLAEAALRDYLAVEEDRERVERVLDAWAGEARDAIRRGDHGALIGLVTILEDARAMSPERAGLLDGGARRVPDRSVLETLVDPAEPERAAAALAMLARLGGPAVDGLFDLLAEEQDRRRRAVLVGHIAALAPGHLDRLVGRLTDPRWYVARNAVNVLWRSGDPGAVAVLEGALAHEMPQVRKEAGLGVAALAGEGAVPHLSVLATDPDAGVRGAALAALASLVAPAAARALAEAARGGPGSAERRRALDELGRHPAPEAAGLLEELATSRTRPRLPRRLRRHARALARVRQGASR